MGAGVSGRQFVSDRDEIYQLHVPLGNLKSRPRPRTLGPVPTTILTFLAAFQLAVAVPSPIVYNGRAGQTRVAPPRLEAEAVIDGRLDESVWQRAAVLTGFSLYQPVDQRPAPDSTEVRVWYSSTAMYFGIRAFEAHGGVTYAVSDRDRVSSDDNVEIHLDTFDE